MSPRRDPNKPFFDVEGDATRFSLPRRKWRELLFIGVIVREGTDYVRDPSRPLPNFRFPDLFPTGARFRMEEDGQRVIIRRVD